MHKLLIASIVCLIFTGCSQGDQPLDLNKKTLAAAESIRPSSECEIYKQKLSADLESSDAFNQIFNDALKAHCIKNDI